jgi:hypothetical protein
LKKSITNKNEAVGVAQGVGPEFKPQYYPPPKEKTYLKSAKKVNKY